MRIRRTLVIALAMVWAACSASPSEPTITVVVPTPGTEAGQSPTTSTSPTSTIDLRPLQVLVVHETAGFRHDSIPAGLDAIVDIGNENGFTVESSDDSTVLLDPGLARTRVVVFLNTTGDILTVPEEHAMEAFVRSGGGFVGIHSASDTEYDWSWYGGLVGAYFDSHPAIQAATIRSTGTDHPAGQGLPSSFERVDEWYNFRSLPGPDVVVLARLDETSYEGGIMGDDHPIAWAQDYDGGRSFYTAGGHTIESHAEPLFRDHVKTGILWSAGSRSEPSGGGAVP